MQRVKAVRGFGRGVKMIFNAAVGKAGKEWMVRFLIS